MLPPEAIEEFKQLYLKLYGKTLSDPEARQRAENLVNLYKAVLEPERVGRIEKSDNRPA